MLVPSTVGAVLEWAGPPQPLVTLEYMRTMTRAEYTSPLMVTTAVDILDDVNGKDPAAMARGLLLWLRAHTRYIPDPLAQQLLKSPLLMLQLIRDNADHRAGGDCVDVAMLGAALAMAVGL